MIHSMKPKYRYFTDHVCIVTHGDGTNPIILSILRTIAANSSVVTFLYWNRLRQVPTFDVPHNVSLVTMLKGCGRGNLRVAALLPVFWLRAVLFLLSARPRLIYAHNFEGAIPSWIAHRLTGVPYIYHIHDNISISHQWNKAVRSFLNGVEGILIRDAEHVVLPDFCRLLPSYECVRHKVSILPNIARIDSHASPVRNDPAKPLIVAALGSLEIGRGLDLLVRAARNNIQVRVVAAGHIRERSLAAAIRQQSNWDYRGLIPHSEVQQIYAEADLVFLFYSPELEIYRLAVPTKLSEALCMGRPVLVNSEVQVSGKLCEWGVAYTCPYDSTALRQSLESIAGNRSELARKSQRACAVYNREFSWQTHESKVVRILRTGSEARR